MSRKIIDTVILDLDNTLFDWFAVWYASFKPIYDEIVKVSGQSLDEVDASIRKVHQARRTSEYTFLIEEVDVLAKARAAGNIRDQLRDALELARRDRDQKLKLYPSVFPSLWELKKKGTKIVAYTESMGFYSAYRLKRFGLDGVIDVLFSPMDHEIPNGVSIEKLRRHPDEFYQLQVTEVRHTPPGELKPNPRVLLDIIKEIGAKTERCVYVGDSLFKDVAMARDVGLLDVHAQYGESQRRPEYGLLQRVSHWTEADVQRESAITSKGLDFTPSIVLKDAFAEIFIHCDFVKFDNPTLPISAEQESKNAIEIWKKCTDVHQHFNDLEMRTRNFAITVVGALLAAISFTYQQGLQANIFGVTFPAGAGFVAAALFAWFGFFLMDRYWYHILLKGAVDHSAKIEARYANTIPEIGLGKTISEASQNVRILGFKMNSTRRLIAFYSGGAILLVVLFLLLFLTKTASPTANSTSSTPPVSEKKYIQGSLSAHSRP
ncbi:HAD family hydrolase [Bradyrhizobium sp. U87765 SZCCT0131]|uniref:HAD family hydrolase n=1 Tax=unclassified Bradyrhizobium TaxID=2631580 RepID=UPI001BA735B4|nr:MULTISPECIES: HAD family hydrolase [unclassified Bradyrhizobium]MBR1223018.1 HAD family hydrolase [Bradyrhizobium sp. U87765 SZCCT0131]MBR1262754.1 HAD family hydrolase [Bradyrhizobium sp. U87765 SZCCT0134]MBR1308774.1 HAD family hydrolase [Bradyrhizobium sp. U87765 SZCCT0110]MBR1318536.1 HAD family hydrolase [Bradyrhizobium sp. U87765 SZCCT0109]MBR1352240.1 HAD family hydrolase [Bradyrhizobium sp. U87765 SZCCT0048]